MAQIPDKVISRVHQASGILKQYGKVVRSYLFGSYVWGKYDQESDIDLAVFIKDLESWDIRRRAKIIASVQKEVGDDLELHLLPASVLTHPEPMSFANKIIQTGILVEEK